MRTFFQGAIALAPIAVLVAHCGGATTTISGGDASVDGNGSSGGSSGGGSSGGGSGSSSGASSSSSGGSSGGSGGSSGASGSGSGGDDGGGGDGGFDCTPPNTPCASPCPAGTYCLVVSGPVEHQLGCTPVPPSCNGKPTCACMGQCFCPKQGVDKCVESQGSLVCDNGAISRREFKKDISYLGDGERQELASEALSIQLARYRYKTEPRDGKEHLGFIIDDMRESSPAVAADRTHVDEYGYASMLLATVQEQQRQIDDLREQVEALRRAECPSPATNATK